jgi:hypothetical protein
LESEHFEHWCAEDADDAGFAPVGVLGNRIHKVLCRLVLEDLAELGLAIALEKSSWSGWMLQTLPKIGNLRLNSLTSEEMMEERVTGSRIFDMMGGW